MTRPGRSMRVIWLLVMLSLVSCATTRPNLNRLYGDLSRKRHYPLILIPGVDYERLMLEPGDGKVTKASVLARTTLDPEQKQTGYFPIEASVFLCRDHEEMPGDITFRNNLLNILLY